MRLGGTIELPGFVDFHTHLRDPSSSQAETMHTGTLAAAEGGYVLVKDMPNNPGRPTWSVMEMLIKHGRIGKDANIYVGCAAGSQPQSDNVGELEAMAALALDLKLYGAPTTGNDKDYEAEDFSESVHEWHRVAPNKPIGFHAGRNNVEDMIGLVAQDLGHHLHLCHISTLDEVEALFTAKKKGLPVTGGVTPHHLLKTAFDVHSEGWFARMQPPLADEAMADRLMYALAHDEIDIIETDHAPHLPEAKLLAEEENPKGIHDPHHTTCFGVPGIEFAFPLMAYQVYRGRISAERLVDAMSTRPAQILGVKLDPRTRSTWRMDMYRIDDEAEMVKSGAGWTPFLGKMAIGKLEALKVKGQTIHAARNMQFTPLSGNKVVTSRGTVI